MTDVEADPNGGIWVGTYEGFARFDGTTWTLYNQANTGMPGTVVADVARRFKRWTYRDRKLSRQHLAVHRRRQHLRRRDLDSLHAREFAIDSLAGGSSGIRWQRQSLGQRHERRCGANHDWRAGGNTDANANRYSNCHTDSYSKRDTNCDTNGYSNNHTNSDTDCYYYAYSKAYPITEASFYTAASRNTAAKTLIAPVVVWVTLRKK